MGCKSTCNTLCQCCVPLWTCEHLYWWLAAIVMRWAWLYGPYCCSIIHFSPCWWILMALHKMGGVKGMLFHGTNIDLIDTCCQQRLAYFSWVYLENTVWLDSIMSSLTSIMFTFLATLGFLGTSVPSYYKMDRSFKLQLFNLRVCLIATNWWG